MITKTGKTIKDLPEFERLRENSEKHGPSPDFGFKAFC